MNNDYEQHTHDLARWQAIADQLEMLADPDRTPLPEAAREDQIADWESAIETVLAVAEMMVGTSARAANKARATDPAQNPEAYGRMVVNGR